MKEQFTISTLIVYLQKVIRNHGDFPICCQDGNEEMSPFDEDGIDFVAGDPESNKPHLRVDHLEFV